MPWVQICSISFCSLRSIYLCSLQWKKKIPLAHNLILCVFCFVFFLFLTGNFHLEWSSLSRETVVFSVCWQQHPACLIAFLLVKVQISNIASLLDDMAAFSFARLTLSWQLQALSSDYYARSENEYQTRVKLWIYFLLRELPFYEINQREPVPNKKDAWYK